MKHLIDIKDLSIKEIDELIEVAKDIMQAPEKYSEKCKHKKLATLFFEPSTRTRLSFEAAMIELGGSVIGFSSASSSSTAKGESVSDTIRTVHSLVTAMSRYKNIKFVLISPEELKIPEYVKEEILEKNNIEYIETNDIEEYMDKLDILYMTRVQRERFLNEEDYLRLKDCYILNKSKLEKAKKGLCIMHPLPRVNEISTEVDDDPRACYFKQVLCGKYIRMALILKLLGTALKVHEREQKGLSQKVHEFEQEVVLPTKCKNPRCITSVEQELDNVFVLTDEEKNTYRCKYCETLKED